MAKVSPLDLCSVLALWVIVLECGLAELQYFPQHTNYNWTEARKHCQVCFKDLVTLTPENIAPIVQNLSSDHWIGLRKRPVSLPVHSHNATSFWSRWANGDPLTFQNWYPGYPVFKSPTMDCCSCQCTCPLQPPTTPQPTLNTTVGRNYSAPNTTYYSSHASHAPFSTATPVLPKPIESECVKSPMVFPDVPDPNENYIEDGCVVLLRFGAWVEKECSMLLPFICYEERFYGQVQVTEITSSSAKLKWKKAPGDIDHYRVEVSKSQNESVFNSLTFLVQNLTPGTEHLVQVFPVKCGRDLNPQIKTFYTAPYKVSNLTVGNVTENCVSLSWSLPVGNADIYWINTKTKGKPDIYVNKTEKTVCNLASGSLHNFTVRSGVGNSSKWSDKSTISAYTRPAKVSNLQAKDITDRSLSLSWDQPEGNATGYFVFWFYKNGSEDQSFNKTDGQNSTNISGLPSGTRITLSVTALANKMRGDPETIEEFTIPKKVQDLRLSKTEHTIDATWKYPEGSPNFIAELFQGNNLIDTKKITTLAVVFKELKSATNYTVKVYSVSNNYKSDEVSASNYTLPVPPREPKCTHRNKTHLRFEWLPPPGTEDVDYKVTLKSDFWGFHQTDDVKNDTEYTFGILKSGTYYSFEVQTKAGDLLSDKVDATKATVPVLKQISLSMVCSSATPLHCDSEATRESALEWMQKKFGSLLNDRIFWNLKSK